MDYRPQKEEPHRTILTAGDSLIVFVGDVSTPIEDITTAKLIINITIYTPGPRYMCCVPVWAKGFDQDTSTFSMIGVTGLIPQFRKPENFQMGRLACLGPTAVADSHTTGQRSKLRVFS